MKQLTTIALLLLSAALSAQDTVWLSGRVAPFTALPNTVYATRTGATVSGFVDLTFTSIGNNLWESQLVSRPEILTGTEAPIAPGRLPNTGYWFFTQTTDRNTVSFSLPSNLIGAEVFVWKNTTIVDKGIIQTQSANQFTYNSISPDQHKLPFGGGFFIQNHPLTLDLQGEWCYVGGRVRMFSTTRPTGLRASQGGTLVTGLPSAQLVGITLEGTNGIAANGVSLKNCTIRYANFGSYLNGTNGARVEDCRFNHITNTGVFMSGCTNTTIVNNSIENVGQEGFGTDQNITNLAYQSIYLQYSSGTTISNNRIVGSGHSGIHFVFSTNTSIRNNFVSDYCRVKSDGGGIYSWAGSQSNYTGNVIDGNIVINGQNKSEATRLPDYCPTWGIYLDDNADRIQVTNNTVSGNPRGGLYLHNVDNVTVTGNTFYNNGLKGEPTGWAQVELLGERTAAVDRIRNLRFENNIVVARTPQQYCLKWDSQPNDILVSDNVFNGNVYARPIGEGNTFRTFVIGEPTALWRTLSGWQNYTGKDQASVRSPKIINALDSLRFDYAITDSSINLRGVWMNLRQQRFSRINLQPYSSSVLLFSENIVLSLTDGGNLRPNNQRKPDIQDCGTYWLINKRGTLVVYSINGQTKSIRQVFPNERVFKQVITDKARFL